METNFLKYQNSFNELTCFNRNIFFIRMNQGLNPNTYLRNHGYLNHNKP